MSEEMEELSFPVDDGDKNYVDIIESVLGPHTYDEAKVPAWINEINEKVMSKLIEVPRPFKYFVNCMNMQRKGANTVIVNSNYWDTGFDRSFVVMWPKEKPNKSEQSKESIQCMVSVYALSMLNSLSTLKSEI